MSVPRRFSSRRRFPLKNIVIVKHYDTFCFCNQIKRNINKLILYMPRFVILICLIGGIKIYVLLVDYVLQEFPLVSIRSLAVDSILLKYHNFRAILIIMIYTMVIPNIKIDTTSYNQLL